MKYRKKPVIIEAVQWNGRNLHEISCLGNGISYEHDTSTELFIDTLEGRMKASIGDYIIKGVNGELYPCKPEIFTKTYEVAE